MSRAGSEGFTCDEARLARLRLGLSQFQVAVELGITPQHLSNYERGRHQMSPKLLFRLAQILGLPLPDYTEPPRSRIDELGEAIDTVDGRLESLERETADIKSMIVNLTAAIAELQSALPPRPPSR